jgi:hypothetical protein
MGNAVKRRNICIALIVERIREAIVRVPHVEGLLAPRANVADFEPQRTSIGCARARMTSNSGCDAEFSV